MQTIDEVREHCRFVGKGIEKAVAVSGTFAIQTRKSHCRRGGEMVHSLP